MTEKDIAIIKLRDEAAKWKNRTLECAYEACNMCKAIIDKERPCETCRIQRVIDEASK